jgi:hypothetical protein
MIDKELLELAAKAAGIKGQYWDSDNDILRGIAPVLCSRYWNPLTDDGDALRLAVKLKLQISPGTYFGGRTSAVRAAVAEAHEIATEDCSIEKATRRAIVRAAAQIGKAMP